MKAPSVARTRATEGRPRGWASAVIRGPERRRHRQWKRAFISVAWGQWIMARALPDDAPAPGEPSPRDPKKVQVVIWTRAHCGACPRAKAVFEAKGVKYRERRLKQGDMRTAARFHERTRGARSVPQIIIEDEHIGGLDALLTLQRRGELDWRLGLGARPARRSLTGALGSLLGR